MSNSQKWVMVAAGFVFAIGILFIGLNGRFKVATLNNKFIRYDTWTGETRSVLSTGTTRQVDWKANSVDLKEDIFDLKENPLP